MKLVGFLRINDFRQVYTSKELHFGRFEICERVLKALENDEVDFWELLDISIKWIKCREFNLNGTDFGAFGIIWNDTKLKVIFLFLLTRFTFAWPSKVQGRTQFSRDPHCGWQNAFEYWFTKPSWEPSFRSRLCSAYFLGSLERISWVGHHGRISNLVKSSVKICSMWCLLWSIFFLYYYKEKIIPRGIGVWGSVFKDYYKRLRMQRRGSHCSARFFILSRTRDSRTRMQDLILDIPSHLKTRSRSDHWTGWPLERVVREYRAITFFSASFKKTAYGPGQVSTIGFNLETVDQRAFKSD